MLSKPHLLAGRFAWLTLPRDPGAPHPHVRLRSHGFSVIDGEWVHMSGYRPATVREAIDLESSATIAERPSVGSRFDDRGWRRKAWDWWWLLRHRPRSALTLVILSKAARYPPMITEQYDDSWCWARARWRRALAIRWGEPWRHRPLDPAQDPEAVAERRQIAEFIRRIDAGADRRRS